MNHIINLLFAYIPEQHKRIKNLYTTEVLTYLLFCNLFCYIIYAVLVFVFKSSALIAGVMFCVANVFIFMALITYNNKIFHNQKLKYEALIVSKQFMPIQAYGAFVRDVRELVVAAGHPFNFTLTKEVINGSNIDLLIEEVFGKGKEPLFEEFILSNGNSISFIQKLSDLDHEQLLRYYLENGK